MLTFLNKSREYRETQMLRHINFLFCIFTILDKHIEGWPFVLLRHDAVNEDILSGKERNASGVSLARLETE